MPSIKRTARRARKEYSDGDKRLTAIGHIWFGDSRWPELSSLSDADRDAWLADEQSQAELLECWTFHREEIESEARAFDGLRPLAALIFEDGLSPRAARAERSRMHHRQAAERARLLKEQIWLAWQAEKLRQ